MSTTLTPKSARACQKYTLLVCVKAFQMYVDGNGDRTIGFEYDLTTAQANAAINAGREYVTFTTGGIGALACQAAITKLTTPQPSATSV